MNNQTNTINNHKTTNGTSPVLSRYSESENQQFANIQAAILAYFRNEGYIFNHNNNASINQISRQLTINVLEPWSALGILLSGPKGTGKTFIMKIISSLTNSFMISIPALTENWKTNNNILVPLLAEHENNHLILDDICAEELKHSYGNPFPITYLLNQRYVAHQDRQILTHATTNMVDEDQLEQYYQGRATDRILGMTVQIYHNDQNWRKL